MSKKKPLEQRKAGYYNACLALCQSGFKDVDAAKKILNLRVHVEKLTDLDTFEAGLVVEWNLPANLFKNVINIAKDSVVSQINKSLGIEEQTTSADYSRAVRWLPNACNINSWEELNNFNEAFHILKDVCFYSSHCMSYMKSFLDMVQENVWDERGIYYKLENNFIVRRPDGDFTDNTITLWQEAYHLLLQQMNELRKIAETNHEIIILPKL